MAAPPKLVNTAGKMLEQSSDNEVTTSPETFFGGRNSMSFCSVQGKCFLEK